MRLGVLAFAVLLLCGVAVPRNRHPAPALPDHFVIGRHTFFDFGPPLDYYELLLVGPAPQGASIERITLTPAGNACTMPAKLEVASATISEPPTSLLGTTNPCTIPEGELNRELKRRKQYPVFSGAEVAMQVQCGGRSRVIRSDILDRDMFDPHPNTPQHTSWTMQLLAKLDHAVGPGVMEKPMFALPGNDEAPLPTSSAATLREIDSGKYDSLFAGAPDKPSDVYRAAQEGPPPPPTVRLVDSSPFQPIDPLMPSYPAIARAAQVEGTVSLTINLDSAGNQTPFFMANGPPLLFKSVEQAVARWKFPQAASNQQIRVRIEFALNCHSQTK